MTLEVDDVTSGGPVAFELMKYQADLVEPVVKLRPMGVVKG